MRPGALYSVQLITLYGALYTIVASCSHYMGPCIVFTLYGALYYTGCIVLIDSILATIFWVDCHICLLASVLDIQSLYI